MQYCITPAERHGSCYHEFYRGKWDEVSCWKEDSLLLHDDVLFSATDFVNALRAVFPDYDPFGETEVSADKWRLLGQYIPKNSDAQAIYEEIDQWATDVFDGADRFTIIGI